MGGGKRGLSVESTSSVKKTARSGGSAADGSPIPVGRPVESRTDAEPSIAAGSGELARPEVPDVAESAHCDIETLMQNIRRWCEQQLPGAIQRSPGLAKLCENKAFWECDALSISVSEKGSLVGHKEPFDQRKVRRRDRREGDVRIEHEH